MALILLPEVIFARLAQRRDRLQFVLSWQVRRPIRTVRLAKLVVVVDVCINLPIEVVHAPPHVLQPLVRRSQLPHRRQRRGGRVHVRKELRAQAAHLVP